MICSICGKDKKQKGEQFFLSHVGVFICETCEGIKRSFKYFIGGTEVSKEIYDKFLEGK